MEVCSKTNTMYIQQIYTPCLSEAAYYIESNGEAAIIDPLRDVQPYLDLAKERNSKIKYVFETHFHADFVSGHLELQEKTNANIVYGPQAKASYPIVSAHDSELFPLGNCFIKVLHTPGHTLESSCFMLIDENQKEHGIFTGDTLFVGDVGRPDLAVSTSNTKEDLAGMLYDSLHEKILPLHEDIMIYPGHGSGSQCGKTLGKETFSTLAAQKQNNYALQTNNKEQFVANVLEGLETPPQYFPKVAQMNKQIHQNLDDLLTQSLEPISPQALQFKMSQESIMLLDTRDALEFAKGHVPGAINIGLNGSFAIWVGSIIEDLKTPIYLVTPPQKQQETITRLARVGYENVKGYLTGSPESWSATFDLKKVKSICPFNFKKLEISQSIIDVRTAGEFKDGHFANAINMPLASLEHEAKQLNNGSVYYLYCKSGYRSMVAASILLKQGFTNIINVKKGYEGLSNPNQPCCSEMKN